MAALLTDDVVVHLESTDPYAGDHEGIDAVRTFLLEMGRLLGEFECDVLDVVTEADDRVTARVRYVVKVAGEDLPSTAVHSHRFVGDRIAEMWLLPLDEEVARRFWDDRGRP